MKYRVLFITSLIVMLAILGLSWLGRTWFGPSGEFGLWSGETQSQDNSQRLFDPYSLTHITHGLLFALVLKLVAKRRPFFEDKAFIIALSIESIWELIENSSFIIERYRSNTFDFNYYGDSILNSVGDIGAAIVGYVIASQLSLSAIVGMIVFCELAGYLWISDNILLNVIRLLFP